MMRKILILGAGRSSYVLIKYLLDNAADNNWFVRVADFSLRSAQKIVGKTKYGDAVFIDVNNEIQRKKEIKNSDIVISMLPANFHLKVANECVRLKKDLVTASYVSKDLENLDNDAKKSGIILLNEIGLDPGIDHMSAMKVIDKIRDDSCKLISFKSYCGGLVHPNYDDNPWNYKFTWNPRNVVLAGSGTAIYLENGCYKYVPYSRLFSQLDSVNVLDAGSFEGYANRDSLAYRKPYGLEDIETLYRGTLRKVGFCSAWDLFVKLGLTDDSYKIPNIKNMSYRNFIDLFLPTNPNLSVEERFCKLLLISQNSSEFMKIKWLGFFSAKKIILDEASPAKVLQSILEKKWSLLEKDKDMIVMQHQFTFIKNKTLRKLSSSLVVYGEDNFRTAMAKTVGLPVAIATKLILNNKINRKGVQIPISKDIYLPILNELEENDINFKEEIVS